MSLPSGCGRRLLLLLQLIVALMYTCQLQTVAADCGPDRCLGLLCIRGRAFDSNGCVLCDCYRPCQNLTCNAQQRCEPELVPGCDGVRCQKYIDRCTDIGEAATTTTRAPCPSVDCTGVRCPYGFRTDEQRCRTCECRELCGDVLKCPAGQICRITSDDCTPGEQCRDAPMPYCTDSVGSSTSSSSTTATSTTTTTTTPTTTTTSTSTTTPTTTTTTTPTTTTTTTPTTTTASTSTTTPTTTTTTTTTPTSTSTTTPTTTTTSTSTRATAVPSVPTVPTTLSTTRSTKTVPTTTTTSATTTTPRTSIRNRLLEAIIRIAANYNIIENMTHFRQRVKEQIGAFLNLSDERIIIKKIMGGSIVVYFGFDEKTNASSDELIEGLERMRSDGVDITYAGKTYEARLVNYTTDADSATTPGHSTGAPGDDDRPESNNNYNLLLLVVLLCVLVPVVIAAIVLIVVVLVKKSRGDLKIAGRSQEWSILSNTSQPVTPQSAENGGYIDLSGSERRLSNLETFA